MSEQSFATPAAITPRINSNIHKQRISIAAMSGAGILSTFLPWAHLGVLTVTGSQGDGWITLVLFLPALLISLIGCKTAPLSTVSRLVAAIPAGIAAVIGIYKIAEFQSRVGDIAQDNPFGAILAVSTRTGIGLYLLVAAGVGITALTCFFLQEKKSTQEIKTDTLDRNSPTVPDYLTFNKKRRIGLGTWLLALTLSIGLPAIYFFAKEGQISDRKEAMETFKMVAGQLAASTGARPAPRSYSSTNSVLPQMNAWSRLSGFGNVAGSRFSFKGLRQKSQGELIGEMTNGEAQDFKIANFTLSIYDQNDDLLDTSGISLSNISAGQTKSFSAYIDSVPSNCKYKIDYDGGF